LLIGDSRLIAGVIPNELGKRALTLAVGGATAIESFHILDTYLRHHEAPQAVVLSLAPFHLVRDEVFWERTGKFKFLEVSELRRATERGQELGASLPGPARSFFHRLPFGRDLDLLATRFGFLPYYQADLIDGRFILNFRSNFDVLAQMRAEAGHRYYGLRDGTDETNNEAHEERFEPSAVLDAYLKDFLDLCRARHIKVAWVTMPFSQSSFEKAPLAYRKGFAEHVAKFLTAYPEVRARTEITALPNRYYGDWSHLNQVGARYFTSELRKSPPDIFGASAPPARETAQEQPGKG
jgi:hypothetical protein